MSEPIPKRIHPQKERERKEKEQEKNPAAFVRNAAAYFFPDDPVMGERFEQRLLTGRCDDPDALNAAMQERNIPATIEIIDLYGATSIDVPPDGPTRYIATHSLNGCTASLTCGESPDGRRTAQMTHFPPFMAKRQQQEIANLRSAMPEDARVTSVLFHEDKRADHIPKLGEHVQITFPESTVQAVPYTAAPDQPDYGMFIVKVPPSGSGEPMSYHSWESSASIETRPSKQQDEL